MHTLIGVKSMKNLNKLYWIKKEIRQIENQIKELSVLSAVSMDGLPKGGGASSPVERFYERLDKLKSKLAAKHDEKLAEQERIEEFLDTIEDDEIRVLARMRFIDNMTYTDIADETFMDRTTVYRKLKRFCEGGEHRDEMLH